MHTNFLNLGQLVCQYCLERLDFNKTYSARRIRHYTLLTHFIYDRNTVSENHKEQQYVFLVFQLAEIASYQTGGMFSVVWNASNRRKKSKKLILTTICAHDQWQIHKSLLGMNVRIKRCQKGTPVTEWGFGGFPAKSLELLSANQCRVPIWWICLQKIHNFSMDFYGSVGCQFWV